MKIEPPSAQEATAGAGATTSSGLASRAYLSLIVVGGALSISGTSSAAPTAVWRAPYTREMGTTAGGSGSDPVDSQSQRRREEARSAISELRRVSGLTWEQIGQLFEVSRRSVHFWASGKPLSASNEERLLRVLDVIRDCDRGSARNNRVALLDAIEGVTPFDLLVAQRFDDARATLGRRTTRSAAALRALSQESKDHRKPLPPEELFDAKTDRVHRERGRARSARTVRNKRRGGS